MSRLKTRLRAEEGMTLIELLIAMTIMSIGIAALVAGFSTGIVSINRANVTSTAGTLADKQMELYRQASFASLPSPTPQTRDHADRPGWSHVLDAGQRCLDLRVGTIARGRLPAARHDPASRPVKLVTIDGARRLGVGAGPLQRDHDLRLLDKLTTLST